jgi:hypothetical protein
MNGFNTLYFMKTKVHNQLNTLKSMCEDVWVELLYIENFCIWWSYCNLGEKKPCRIIEVSMWVYIQFVVVNFFFKMI